MRRFFAAVQQTDSWRPMRLAEEYVGGGHDRPVYGKMLSARGVKFQYPMSSLLLTRHLNLSWLNGLSWFSVIVVIVAIWRILRRTGAGTPLEFRHDDPAVGVALIGLTLSLYPGGGAYSLGQIQAWGAALLALAVLAWVSERDDLAGVAVGLACLLKPTYGIFVVWAAVRRRTRFLVPLLGVVLLGTLAALVAYGWPDNVDYLTALRIMSRGGEAFYPNQSFNGFLNRLMGTADSLVFDRHAFAPYHPLVYAGTLTAFVALVGLALWLAALRRVDGLPLVRRLVVAVVRVFLDRVGAVLESQNPPGARVAFLEWHRQPATCVVAVRGGTPGADRIVPLPGVCRKGKGDLQGARPV